ncbi:MAG: efflux RND transporter periplasmic adaptor subunit [Phycisphaeraceae bacterium]|nr:efflux RND transporter periplasmic adaptor subunit [Phycisphaeraceae bacterium]
MQHQQRDGRFIGLQLLAGLLMSWVTVIGGCSGNGEEGQAGPPDGNNGGGPPPARVRFGEVREEILQDRWSVIGRLAEVSRAAIASEQPGRILEVYVEEGDEVHGPRDGEPGTLLARLDSTFTEISINELDADIAEAQANIAERTARMQRLESEYEFLAGLLRTDSARQKEVDDARMELAAGRARLLAGEAMLATLKAQRTRREEELRRSKIYAEFDGVVVRRLAEPGQWASQGSVIAEVVSRGRIDALIDVPEDLIAATGVGQEMNIHIDAWELDLSGKVVSIVPRAAGAARTFPVKVRLSDMVKMPVAATDLVTVDEPGRDADPIKIERRLLPGMSISAMIPTGEPVRVFTVPRDAVLFTAGGEVIWYAANGISGRVMVRTLFSEGDRVAVRLLQPDANFEAGLRVVIEGAERLMAPGQPLMDAELAPNQMPDGPPANEEEPNALETSGEDRAWAGAIEPSPPCGSVDSPPLSPICDKWRPGVAPLAMSEN